MPAQLDTLPAADSVQHHVPDREVVLDLPGLLADHLRAIGDDAVRRVIGAGRTIRRVARATRSASRTPLALHRAALQQSAALAAETAGPAAREAHRVYATRITAAEQ